MDLSHDEIVKNAGMGKTTLYNCYHGKDVRINIPIRIFIAVNNILDSDDKKKLLYLLHIKLCEAIKKLEEQNSN